MGGFGGLGRTIGDFGDQVGDEEGRGGVGEVVSYELQVGDDPHHGGVLRRRQRACLGRSFGAGRLLTLMLTLSRNCMV